MAMVYWVREVMEEMVPNPNEARMKEKEKEYEKGKGYLGRKSLAWKIRYNDLEDASNQESR